MTGTEIITAFNTLRAGLKELNEYAKIAEDRKIKDLVSATLDQIIPIQFGLSDLKQENDQLRTEIASLNERLNEKAKFIYKRNAAWKITDNGEEGPYCPNCHNRLVAESAIPGISAKRYNCFTCTSSVTIT
jgi:regulator of replication initiation timing